MNTGKTRYVLKSGENFIAIDKSSGGYPYTVPGVDEAKIFDTRDAAVKYTSVFVRNEGGVGKWPWTLHEVYTQVGPGHVVTNIEVGNYNKDTDIGNFIGMLRRTGAPYKVEAGPLYTEVFFNDSKLKFNTLDGKFVGNKYE